MAWRYFVVLLIFVLFLGKYYFQHLRTMMHYMCYISYIPKKFLLLIHFCYLGFQTSNLIDKPLDFNIGQYKIFYIKC